MEEFLSQIYDESILLKKRFEITETKKWDYLTVLNELSVQIGHVFMIDYNNSLNEEYRNIVNMGDEISDVFFQLILLIFYLGFDIKTIKFNCNASELSSFVIAYGQCSEALLEKNGMRFSKSRPGFNTIDEYIINKISQMCSIIYNYSNSKGIDVRKEYDLMLIDANQFLDNFNNKKENL